MKDSDTDETIHSVVWKAASRVTLERMKSTHYSPSFNSKPLPSHGACGQFPLLQCEFWPPNFSFQWTLATSAAAYDLGANCSHEPSLQCSGPQTQSWFQIEKKVCLYPKCRCKESGGRKKDCWTSRLSNQAVVILYQFISLGVMADVGSDVNDHRTSQLPAPQKPSSVS